MRWPALLSAFAKVWPFLVAALGCTAALIRLIGSSTPTSTTHILIRVAILCFFISVLLAVVEGQREYRRLTATVLATLNTVPEHGGAIRKYRLATQAGDVQLRDVKVWVLEPTPNWISVNFSGFALHFPFRSWRPGIGPESDSCFINPNATEFFELMRSWNSGATGDPQVELNGQTFGAPEEPWVLPLKIEWAAGFKELKLLIHSVGGESQVVLQSEQLPQIGKSGWASVFKWAAVGALIAAIAVLLLSVPEISRRLGVEHTAPASQSATQPDQKPPTLRDLFEKDFPYVMKAQDQSMEIQWQDGSALHVSRQVYLDFPAKTQFVGFYIPSSGQFQTRTYNASIQLAEAVKQAISDLPKRAHVTAGYRDENNTLEDLTFSGRVLLYHEDFLSIPQKADILKAYAAKGFDVQFRGPDYLADQVIAWHHQHDPK
jgi:hypothetical protein